MKKLGNVIRASLKHAQSWIIGNVERLVAYTEMSTNISHVTYAACTADTTWRTNIDNSGLALAFSLD